MRLCAKENCTGCGACAEICPRHCIKMTPDQLGFIFPAVNEKECINCHLCEKTCPSLNPLPLQKVQKVYAAWAKDDTIRTSSSSGGIFSVFAEYVLAHNGAINGVAFDSNLHLQHEIAYNPGESSRFRGSKYVQSDTNGIFQIIKDHLESGKEVLFTGVPCQVAGLKSFLKKEYENLICCDIICHGVPSQKFLKHCVKLLCPLSFSEIQNVQFRNLSGWGNFRLHIWGNDGKEWVSSDDQNEYINAFLAGAVSNENCYHCRYACHDRIGDITVGDFWGLGVWKKFRHDTKHGCSVVLINTEKGTRFFESVKDSLFTEERSFKEACRENDQLQAPMKRPAERDVFAQADWENFVKKM